MASVWIHAALLTLSLLAQCTLCNIISVSNNEHQLARIVCLPDENCDIYCHEHDACHDGYIQCAPGFACDVTCSAASSCQNLTMNATRASLFTLHDCGQHACDNMTVYFPPNTNGVPKGILNVDRDLNSYSNHLQFYAVNGWNDVYVANQANFSHGNNGVMYCAPMYEEQCAFAVDAWACANDDDICNTYVTNNDGITDFDGNAGTPPSHTKASVTATDANLNDDEDVVSFVTMIADLDQLWYIVAAILIFLCCFLCLLMYLIRRAYAVHYETAKQLKMAVDELKDFKSMQDNMLVQSRTDESYTLQQQQMMTRPPHKMTAEATAEQGHEDEYKQRLNGADHTIDMDGGDDGHDDDRPPLYRGGREHRGAAAANVNANAAVPKRPYLVSSGPESYTMPSMLPSATAHLPAVPLEAEHSEDSKAYDRYHIHRANSTREPMLITPMVMDPTAAAAVDGDEKKNRKKKKKSSRHKHKHKSKTKKSKNRHKDGGHKFKKLAMAHADDDDEDDLDDQDADSTDPEVAASDDDEEKDHLAAHVHVPLQEEDEDEEETTLVKEVDAQSTQTIDEDEEEEDEDELATRNAKLTKQTYPLKPNKHGVEKWDPRTPVNSVGSPSMTPAKRHFDLKQPVSSSATGQSQTSIDINGNGGSRSRPRQKSRNFMEMKTAMMLNPNSNHNNTHKGGASRHMSSQKTMASELGLSPSMMSVRTTNTVNTMGTFVMNKSVNEQNEDEFIEHQHMPSMLFQQHGHMPSGTMSSFHVDGREHGHTFEDSTASMNLFVGVGNGVGAGQAASSQTTVQTSVNSRSQSQRNSDESEDSSEDSDSQSQSQSQSQSTDIMEILTKKTTKQTGHDNLNVPAAHADTSGAGVGGGSAAIPNMSVSASTLNPKTPQNQKMVVDIFDGLTGMVPPVSSSNTKNRNELARDSASNSYLYVQRASNGGSEASRSSNPFADTVIGSAVSASTSSSSSSSVSQRSSADSHDEDEEESDGTAQEILDKLLSAKKTAKSVTSKRSHYDDAEELKASDEHGDEDDDEDEDEQDESLIDGSDDGRTVILNEEVSAGTDENENAMQTVPAAVE